MYCDNCGTPVNPGQNFCSRCGKQLVATVQPPAPEEAPPPPPPSAPLPLRSEHRVQGHIKILAIVWLVISVLDFAPALGFLFGGGIAMHFIPMPVRVFLMPVAGFITVFLLARAVVGLLVGWGLLQYRPWARVLALVLGVISLLHFPFGTALGIYTLWVLLPAESEREYRHLAGAAY